MEYRGVGLSHFFSFSKLYIFSFPYYLLWLILFPLFVRRMQFLFSFDAAEELKDAISNKNHELVLIQSMNLVDEIWNDSRPKPPRKPTRVHDIKYAGIDVTSKLSSVRSQLSENGCDAVVISMLDEVAWLLNMVIFASIFLYKVYVIMSIPNLPE